jgi:hypothetical protein
LEQHRASKQSTSNRNDFNLSKTKCIYNAPLRFDI